MGEQSQLRVFVLFVFLVIVLSVAGSAVAAVTVIPDVPGLSGGGYTPSLGQLKGTQPWASGNYSAVGKVSIGGNPLSIPAKIPLAAEAGALVKTGMRLNPTLLAGTLAAGWLAEQGMNYVAGQGWMKGGAGGTLAEAGPVFTSQQADGDICVQAHSATTPNMGNCYQSQGGGYANSGVGGCPVRSCPDGACDGGGALWAQDYMNLWRPKNPFPSGCSLFQPDLSPASDADWDALPNPASAVAPELPGAGYMPKGAPVGKPVYDAGDYPVGSPYKAPDGTTVQPMATVTNNSSVTNNYNNAVTVVTYNITTHNSDGTAIPNPTKTPTNEQQTECERNPESAGCLPLGEYEHGMPSASVNFAFTPEASPLQAGCPAPIQVLGHSLSFQPACDAMVMIKPVVLGMAAVMAAFILIGGFREVM